MTADCVCGGIISARSEVMVPVAVLAHNRSLLHRTWRLLRSAEWATNPAWVNPAVLAERLPTGTYLDPRRCWPTADDEPVDLIQGDVGASADDAEGSVVPTHLVRLWTRLRGQLH